jgi:lipoate-protein ligase B
MVRDAVSLALGQVGITALCYDGLHSVWGRTGMLAATGISVQQNVSCFGSYINVSPDMSLFGYVDTAWQLPVDQSRRTMSSLMVENRKAARMANLRSAVVESFAQVFEYSDYDMHTGHPQLLPQSVLKPLSEI